MAGDTTSSTTVHTKRGVCLAYRSDYRGSGEFYSDSPIFTVTALDYYLLFRGGDVVVVGGVLDARPPLTSTARGPLLLLEKMLTGSAAASPLCWIGANKWRCSKAAAGAHLIVFEARLSHLEPWAWSTLTRTRYIVLVPSQRVRGEGSDIWIKSN